MAGPIRLSDRVLFALDGLFFGAAFIIRTGSTSAIPWVQAAFAPYAWLQYVFAFLGAFTAAYVWFGRSLRIALILAAFFLVGYIVLSTGWGL